MEERLVLKPPAATTACRLCTAALHCSCLWYEASQVAHKQSSPLAQPSLAATPTHLWPTGWRPATCVSCSAGACWAACTPRHAAGCAAPPPAPRRAGGRSSSAWRGPRGSPPPAATPAAGPSSGLGWWTEGKRPHRAPPRLRQPGPGCRVPPPRPPSSSRRSWGPRAGTYCRVPMSKRPGTGERSGIRYQAGPTQRRPLAVWPKHSCGCTVWLS